MRIFFNGLNYFIYSLKPLATFLMRIIAMEINKWKQPRLPLIFLNALRNLIRVPLIFHPLLCLGHADFQSS